MNQPPRTADDTPLPSAVPELGTGRRFAHPVYRKVAWRLVPFLCLLYLLNLLDRSNVGFARLTMQNDLGIDENVFDLGYGIFYVGYLAFEVPANLLMTRVGA